MLCRKITPEERDRMLQYRDMMFSDDLETVELGKSLADIEFGKYSLAEHNSNTLHQIIELEDFNYSSNNITNGVRFWLFYAATRRDYFYE